MAVVGMWVAIVGYGLAYAGMSKLSGHQCGIVQAFQGKCGSASTASAPSSGQTQQGRMLASQQQQASMIGTQPISQVA